MNQTKRPNPEKHYDIHWFDEQRPMPYGLARDVIKRVAATRRRNPEAMLGVTTADVVGNLGCVALDPDSNVVGYVRAKGSRLEVTQQNQPKIVQEVGSLYAHPYFRGEGMAEELIADLCMCIGRTALPDVLEARCRNEASRNAFEKNGFAHTQTTDTGIMIVSRQMVPAASERAVMLERSLVEAA